jgi:hypothetical protein
MRSYHTIIRRRREGKLPENRRKGTEMSKPHDDRFRKRSVRFDANMVQQERTKRAAGTELLGKHEKQDGFLVGGDSSVIQKTENISIKIA